MAEHRRAVAAWALGVSAVAAAFCGVFASRTTTRLANNGWFIVCLVVALIAFLISLIAGFPDLAGWLRELWGGKAAKAEHTPVSLVTNHWRHTTDGFGASVMLHLPQKAFSHRGYMRPAEDRQSSIRIGIFVACDPLAPDGPSTSELRSRFLAFLGGPALTDLIMASTHVGDGTAWTPLAGNGRMTLEAILGDADEPRAPVASAMLLLPQQDVSAYGRDRRGAELVIHIEPRDSAGAPAAPASLAVWHDRLTKALGVSAALADFLRQDAQVGTHGDPPAQFGTWLSAPRAITELVDVGEMKPLPGSWAANEFLGLALGDQHGKDLAGTAGDMLRQLCDHTLHLDGYEQVLDRIGQANARQAASPREPGSPGSRADRSTLSINAARQLLEDVHLSKKTLRLLPYTESAAGSPLSYGERLSRAHPMHDALAHALDTTVPLLTDPEVARRFRLFADYCDHVSGPRVDAQDIHRAVDAVIAYSDHLRDCLVAHIDGKQIPPELHVDIPGAELNSPAGQ
jgi:hypothetical protein